MEYGVEPLAQKIPNLFSLSLNKDAYVVDYWCIVTHSWNLGLGEICSIMSLTIWP